MKQAVTRKLISCFVFLCGIVYSGMAQPLGLSGTADSIIHSYCTICARKPADSFHIFYASRDEDRAAAGFHNCLVALGENNVDSGYLYALETITQARVPGEPVSLYARFLKARILYFKDSYKEALADYQLLFRNAGIDKNITAYICSNIASIYTEQAKFDSALNYFNIWENTYAVLAEPVTARKIYNNIGVCHLHLQNYAKADLYFQKSISIARQLNDTTGLANLYINIGSSYYNQDLRNAAMPFFKKAVDFAKASNRTEELMKAYQNMALIEAKSRNYRSAYEYRRLYDSLAEIKWSSDNISELKEQEKKLAVQEQEHRLALSQKENKLQALQLSKRDLEISNQNWQRNMFLVLAILFLSFTAMLYWAYRQKIKQNSIISTQREELSLLNETKDQLFSIISHDLRTLVYTLKLTLARLRSALAQNNLPETARLAESTESISVSTYGLLNNLLHWALSQTEKLQNKPERLNAKDIIDEVYGDYASVAASKMIVFHISAADGLYFTCDSNSVKIILRNLVDNAIKYTPADGYIHVSAVLVSGRCNITVADNGLGMDQEDADAFMTGGIVNTQKDTQGNKSTGLGLWLVKTMTEKNGGRLSVTSRRHEGTSITVSFLSVA